MFWGVITGTGREGAPVLIEPHTQDEQIVGDGQSYQVIRMLRGGPATSLERGAVDEMLPKLLEGLGGIGVDISEDDVFINGPAIVLRPVARIDSPGSESEPRSGNRRQSKAIPGYLRH